MRDKAKKDDKKAWPAKKNENYELQALEKNLSQHPKWILGQYAEM